MTKHFRIEDYPCYRVIKKDNKVVMWVAHNEGDAKAIANHLEQIYDLKKKKRGKKK